MRWLVPTLAYVCLLGLLGVTSKLALRTLNWQELILWATIGYMIVSGGLLLSGQTEVRVTTGTSWAIASGVLAIGSLVLLYLALTTGEASKVIPVSASYPAVTLFFAAVVLGESVSLVRWLGCAMVIGGVVLVTAAR
jgi:transporter family protein